MRMSEPPGVMGNSFLHWLGGAVDQPGETGNFSGRSPGVKDPFTTNLGDDFLGNP